MTLLVGSIFHMTRKIVSEMTYNVSMGTLNPTIPIPLPSVLLLVYRRLNRFVGSFCVLTLCDPIDKHRRWCSIHRIKHRGCNRFTNWNDTHILWIVYESKTDGLRMPFQAPTVTLGVSRTRVARVRISLINHWLGDDCKIVANWHWQGCMLSVICLAYYKLWNNNNMWIYKAHNVSKQAESEAPNWKSFSSPVFSEIVVGCRSLTVELARSVSLSRTFAFDIDNRFLSTTVCLGRPVKMC